MTRAERNPSRVHLLIVVGMAADELAMLEATQSVVGSQLCEREPSSTGYPGCRCKNLQSSIDALAGVHGAQLASPVTHVLEQASVDYMEPAETP